MLSAEATPAFGLPPQSSGKRNLALLAALGQTLIAVTTAFVARATLRVIEPYALLMLRLVGAALIIGLWALPRRPWRLPRRELTAMLGLGLLGVTVNQVCFLRGLAESTPARSSLLYALTPLFVFVLAQLRGHERFSAVRLAGIIAAFLGVGVVLADRQGFAGVSLRGDLILLLGVLGWAAYSALGRPVLLRHDALVVTAVALCGGTLAFMPVGVPAALALDFAAIPGWAWGAVAFMALASSVGGYILWYFAIRHLPASRVTIFMNLQPPLVVLVSWLALGEPITLTFVLGGLLVLAGVRLAVQQPR